MSPLQVSVAPPLVKPIDAVTASDVDLAGGKGANLGELLRAGFRVPDGFILTTSAYDLAAQSARVDPRNPIEAGDKLRSGQIPEPIASAATDAYMRLGKPPVAVRSSATAEDLPGASFAGQQDTFLNVFGEDDLEDAIRRCWASLWNERAVAYRRANNIDDSRVSLAVVVQRMVDATAAGVLFTADPLTGRRRQASIDAVAGLGEKLVSGAVNPDHYVVDSAASKIVERRLTRRTAVLFDTELLDLATLGDRVERHFGAPQDVEFAFDKRRTLWLVQSRPITTLYPLPGNTRDPSHDLRVYFSISVFQGYFEPMTPMGIQLFKLVGTSVSRPFGARIATPSSGPSFLVEAGLRLFVDVSAVVRDRLGRRIFQSATAAGESRTSFVFSKLALDPRLDPVHRSPIVTVYHIAKGMLRAGIPLAALRVLLSPSATRTRYVREIEQLAQIHLPPDASAARRLDAFEHLLLNAPGLMLPRLLGVMAPAMLALGLASRLLRDHATPQELQTITRSARFNPTTEMDLALWSLSVNLRSDPESRSVLLDRTPEELARAYQIGSLPKVLQDSLSQFLARYGFRSIGEIDVGVLRWSEDPAHILGVLSNYIRVDDGAPAPDELFARGEHDAEAMIRTLTSRVRGPKRVLVGFVLRRVRQLIGSRELPKFLVIRHLVAPGRDLLKAAGTELAERGRVGAAEDIFFLTLPEARRAVAGEDMQHIVATRRATFDRERARGRIPRLLLSDGTDAEVALVPVIAGDLRGSPASPGVATGLARVVLSPRGARLEPGEILVAPSTDPGWTPLFLTAAGLVMEMGGMMSHGAVVAREYGIPAVVGVAGATERITTGKRVTVDGSAGTVSVEPAQP